MEANNLCKYEHPKYICASEDRKERQGCDYYFPKDDFGECKYYNHHRCGDCDLSSAQFESGR